MFDMEDDMEQALIATQLVFFLLGGIGLFFMGIRSLYWMSDKEEAKKAKQE